MYVLFLSLHNLILKLYNISKKIKLNYISGFFFLDQTLIYHEIRYNNPYLDSMERKVEDEFPSFIRYCEIEAMRCKMSIFLIVENY